MWFNGAWCTAQEAWLGLAYANKQWDAWHGYLDILQDPPLFPVQSRWHTNVPKGFGLNTRGKLRKVENAKSGNLFLFQKKLKVENQKY